MNLAKDKKAQLTNPLLGLVRLLSRIDLLEDRIVKGIFTEKEQVLIQLSREVESMKDTFRHDCRSLIEQQHSRDHADIDLSMVKQLQKHFDKWQIIYMEFESAAKDSHEEIKGKIAKHVQLYGEVLQKVCQTDYRKTSEMQDIELACKILQSREQ